MLAMYKEHVLGEKPTPGIVPLSAIAPGRPQARREDRSRWLLRRLDFPDSPGSRAARLARQSFHWWRLYAEARRQGSFLIAESC